MNLFKKMFVFCLVAIISLEAIFSTESPSNATIIRKRRYLDFLPKSRMFFRANVKDNMFKTNQIWAHAYGYRANYPIENGKRAKRSDVYETIEDLIGQHGFDGRACILKTFCDASQALTPKSGMFFKLFKLIFSGNSRNAKTPSDDSTGSNSVPEGDIERYPYLGSSDCTELVKHCPLNLFSVTPYTDV